MTAHRRPYSTVNLHGRNWGIEPIFDWSNERALQAACEQRLRAFPAPYVGLTLHFHQYEKNSRRRVRGQAAQATVRALLARLNGQCRPRKKNPRGLRTFFVKEDGPDTGIHYHGGIELPVGLTQPEFTALIEAGWRKEELGKSIHFCHDNGPEWLRYCVKLKPTGQLCQHIDFENCNY